MIETQPSWRKYAICALCMSVAALSACSPDEEPPPQAAEDDGGSFLTQPTDKLTPGVHAQLVLPMRNPVDTPAVDSVQSLQINGPGKFHLVPRHQDRPAYYFIGDGNDNDGFNLSIFLPADSKSGVYGLTATSPFNTGRAFEIKLDSDDYGSFGYRTTGILTLNQLQALSSGTILASGTYAFRSANEAGELVEVIGSFRIDDNSASP
ncbi:MAG: hypothetical protein MI750_14315 [Xanthomonadales bacterium]|nr:hypothetical protein [Xanthomonadales bacterium]